MDYQHDPLRQADYLRQCLAQDKRPLGFFLSAGCPLAIRVTKEGKEGPLIPDVAGLTIGVRVAIDATDAKTLLSNIFAQLTNDGNSDPNIEDVLSHVRSLRQVAGNEGARGLTGKDLDRLDHLVCKTIVDQTNKHLPHSDTPYHKLANWAGSVSRSHPVEIFTTNYDLLLEQAFEEGRVCYFDGFVGARKAFFDLRAIEEDVLPPRWARVWKLHGSINWGRNQDGTIFRAGVSEKEAGVIHPSHLKYDESRRMPYLAMLDRLRSFLRRPAAVLAICGYSFRDQHLNAVVTEALQGNSSATVFGLMYGGVEKYPKAQILAKNLSNLSILARNGAIIGRKEGAWQSKEKPDGPSVESAPVEWIPEDDGKAEGIHRAAFMLGDFSRLGGFLEDLVGLARDHQQTEEVSK